VIIDLETRLAARDVAKLLKKTYVPHVPRNSHENCALTAMSCVRAPFALISLIQSVSAQDGFEGGVARWSDAKGKQYVIETFEKIASET